MAKSGFRWVTSPEQLRQGIQDYGEQVVAAVMAVAQYIATQAQNDMRTNASWTDRTGNARAGLFSMAEIAANDVVTIYLSHGSTIDYGEDLELNYGMRYAIIVPTMQRILPELERMLNGIFK
ncbi:MAG: hypothetical protein GY943_16780 [Chloroflexi bacterium]|nr:hypothetical protein [Chloroflexota bacterium]